MTKWNKLKVNNMKIYTVEFDPIYPVGCCLIIAAENEAQALEIAKKTVTHTEITAGQVSEVDVSKPCVIVYQSGDY